MDKNLHNVYLSLSEYITKFEDDMSNEQIRMLGYLLAQLEDLINQEPII